MLNYISWDVSPIILTIGSFSLRWYSLLLTSGFLLGFFIIRRMFEKEGVSEKEFQIFIRYLFFSTIIGLRLGHCLFYDPKYYLTHPLEILKVWEGGLASHGAAIGILIGLFLYVRKHKKSFIWILDRVVIMVCIVGAMVRIGNLMNSEIIGSSTNYKNAFLFVHSVNKYLVQPNPDVIKSYKITQLETDTVVNDITYAKLELEVEFKSGVTEQFIGNDIQNYFKKIVDNRKSVSENIKLFDDYKFSIEKGNSKNVATCTIWAIPRFPSQLLESFFYVLLFVVLMIFYQRYKANLIGGVFFSSFLLALFVYRFFIEFIKHDQVDFESSMVLNMGQLLSIPFIIAGIVLLVYSLKQRKVLSFSKK